MTSALRQRRSIVAAQPSLRAMAALFRATPTEVLAEVIAILDRDPRFDRLGVSVARDEMRLRTLRVIK